MENTIHILYCGDHGYVPMLGVSMTSVIWNNTDSKCVFHFLVDDVSQKDMAKLQKAYALYRNIEGIIIHKIPLQSEEMQVFRSVKSDYHEAVNYRLLATKLLGDNIEKVLYLDGDVICRQSLKDLWQLDLGEALAAAAPDPLEAGQVQRFGGTEYFNSGVLLIDLQRWRQEHILEQLLDYYRARQGQEVWFPDQDALNAVCRGRILRLDRRYNYNISCNFNTPGRKPDIEADTCLMHFTGPITKPWYVTCLDRRSVLWTEYQNRSLWSDLPVAGDAALFAEMKQIRRLFEDGRGEAGFARYCQLIRRFTERWQPAVFL